MIEGFVASDRGYQSVITGDHNLLLQQLVKEVLAVLDSPDQPSVFLAAVAGDINRGAPKDPALGHLLPCMSHDEAEAERLRAMTEDYLRAEKSSRLRRLRAELERVRVLGAGGIFIPSDRAWDWLTALNDIRLALAGELQVESDADMEQIERQIAADNVNEDGRTNTARIYFLVTWWQDSLLRAMQMEAPTN